MNRTQRRALKRANGNVERAAAILKAQAGPTANPDAIAADIEGMEHEDD